MLDSVDIEVVKKTTRDTIFKANADDTLQELTPRLVRQRVEEQLSLDNGLLDDAEYKSVVKTAIAAAMAEIDESNEEASGAVAQAEAGASPSAPEKSAKTEFGKRKKAAKPKSDEGKGGEDEKRPKQPKKKATSTAGGKKGKSVRSTSVVDSSDEEGNEGRKASPKKPPKKSAKVDEAETKPPLKKRQKKTMVKSDDEGERELSPSTSSAPKSASINGVKPESKQKDTEQGDGKKSESEMSFAEDEPPKRKRKKGTKDEASKPRKRATKTKGDDLSPNETEIKRLKGFVIACGVRKMWARELKGMDEGEQIRHLKKLLADLGMTGRLSMEKAKHIKAQRELAQELDDVREFEKAVVNGPTASRRSKSKTNHVEEAVSEKEDEEEEEEEAEEDVQPRKRKMNARASITAFLGDQSDSD